MKKKYYYGSPVVVFGWSTQTGDDGFEWSYTKFPDETSPEEGKEYPLSEVWDKDLVFDGIHRDNQGGTSHVEVRYLDRTEFQQEGKYIADIRDAFTTGHPFKLSNGYTKHDSETDTDITYQFDKTKSYLIRRNGCSGPPKVVFLYINESGENCYKVVTVQEIRSEVNSVTENEAKLTHYHFGDWKKAEAHYELVGNIYKVDSVSDEVVTFPKQVTEFNEYYQAELVPNEYKLSLDSQLFLDTTNQKVINVAQMMLLGDYNLQAGVEGNYIYERATNKTSNRHSDTDISYKSLVQVSFYFPITEYTPITLQVTTADDQLSGTDYSLTVGDNNTYTTSFEMPGQDSYIKILFTKNDTTN